MEKDAQAKGIQKKVSALTGIKLKAKWPVIHLSQRWECRVCVLHLIQPSPCITVWKSCCYGNVRGRELVRALCGFHADRKFSSDRLASRCVYGAVTYNQLLTVCVCDRRRKTQKQINKKRKKESVEKRKRYVITRSAVSWSITRNLFLWLTRRKEGGVWRCVEEREKERALKKICIISHWCHMQF